MLSTPTRFRLSISPAAALVLGLSVSGCQTLAPTPAPPASAQLVEVGFSPEGGAVSLVLRTIRSARHTLRVAAYEFTSRDVAQALAEARGSGVEIEVVVDERASRQKADAAALAVLVGAGIPVRTVSSYVVHHDKYMVADGATVETGSYNYTNAAARRNSENVLVVRDNPALAARYLAHWQSRWNQGVPYAAGGR